MTQEEFFGAIEHNLQLLAAKRAELPLYNIPRIGIFLGKFGNLKLLSRIKEFKCIAKGGDPQCPDNVRCYDLLSSKALFVGPIRFRVFACFADAPTAEGYRLAKRAIRRWYQQSGWANNECEMPYAAAIVVGAASPWEDGLTPNAVDPPSANVNIAFRMLAASSPQPGNGMVIEKEGDVGACIIVYQALVPETFDKVERRVRDCVENLFLPNGDVIGGGYLTVRKVMDRLPKIPYKVIVNIFVKMQGEGNYRKDLLPKDAGRELDEQRVYLEKRPPSFLKKWLSRLEPEWYTQNRVSRLVGLGSVGALLTVPLQLFEHFIPDLIMPYRFMIFLVVSSLLGVCLILWLWFLLRRRI